MLEILAAKKFYSGRQVLDIPSLKLDKGIYWLQGINGSGKTTLLRMIAGLIPFNGEILFNSISINYRKLDYRRHVSLAEAEPLYPDFVTGRELVRFYQHIRKASFHQINKLTDRFGMDPYLSIPIKSYSSGMIKKLSLLLAFIGTPPLILLDEPLATLDADALVSLPELMRGHQEEFGISFIFSSHQAIKTGSLHIDRKLMISSQTIHVSE